MKTELELLGKSITIASRARRRWLVVAIYAAFAGLIVGWFFAYGRSTLGIFIILAFLLIANFLGGRTYRGGLAPPVDSGDERDLHRRDHAHFLAYWYLDFAFIPALLAAGFKNIESSAAWSPALRAFLDNLPYGLLIAAGVLYYTLPQAILLWTEPDMEQEG